VNVRKPREDYKVIILDMDGTLYFQPPFRFCMAFSLAAYYAVHFWRLRELFLLREIRKSREKGQFHPSERNADEKTRAVLAYWLYEYPLKYIWRFRDKKLISLVNGLKSGGAMIVVYSDYPADGKACAIGVDADRCYCADDGIVGCLKPNAAGLKNILHDIGADARDCLLIGDRYEKDGLCARGAGLDFVILPRTKHARYRKERL